jgi:hypothetical protein
MRRIDLELESEIVRLVMAEKWLIGTTARQLGVHHSVVRRVLRQAGLPLPKLRPRPSKLDPYMPFVIETLEKYPKLPASRVWHMLRERGFLVASRGCANSSAWCAPDRRPRRTCGCPHCRASRPRSTGRTLGLSEILWVRVSG